MLPLSSLSVCRPEDEEGHLCSSHKILPPEGEVRGWRREAENLKLSSEDSGGAETGVNLTVFTGGRPGSGGPITKTGSGRGPVGLGTKADTRQGRRRRVGTAGTKGTEEITGFSLSTESESDLSLIWRKKKCLRLSEHSKGSSVQRRQRRLQGVVQYKNKLCIQQSSR